MRQVHLFNDHIYEIHSHAVARNPIFTDEILCRRFLKKINKYLGPLCEILHYTLQENQFRLVVKLKSRATFIEFEQKKKQGIHQEEIGFTTHIFSQAMANLLSSMAIHFNRKNGRTGALFARRFARRLITCKKELDLVLLSMSKMEKLHRYRGYWKYRGKVKNNRKRKKNNRNMANLWERNGGFFHRKEQGEHPILNSFLSINKIQLRGHFDNLPPRNIYDIFNRFTIQLYLKNSP